MTFYHGSPIGGLTELKPFLSEHGKSYIYFATNPLVAMLYAVKPVPKPFSFYPYGFDKDGNVIYSEYYHNAFHDIYSGKKGYLYECRKLPDSDNPTQINCAYTCEQTLKADYVTEIPDIYEYLIGQQQSGRFIIKSRDDISEKEMNFVFSELRKYIDDYNLRSSPEHEMSVFIKTHFPNVWNG